MLQSFCLVCSSNSATSLCACVFPVTPLCEQAECRTTHKQKGGFHSFLPWTLSAHLNSLEDVQRLRTAMLLIQEADEWLPTQRV